MTAILGSSGRHGIRVSELRSLAKIEAELLKGSRNYFEKEDFTEIIVPRITKVTGSCENLDTLFELGYFGQRAYLMQTGQLFLELVVPSLEKVWCCGQSFRAEARVDNRHLAEFTLLEMEFCGNFERLLSMIESVIAAMIKRVLEYCPEELEKLSTNKRGLEDFRPPFDRITYSEAAKILNLVWGQDIDGTQERLLVEKCGGRPLFITHHPEEMKFFNMRTNSENSKLVNSADLILPFSGEAVGAGEREFEYERIYNRLKKSSMLRQLEQRGGSISDFDWYLRHLRENGSVQHSGCGIGFNRVIQYVLGSRDIRESTLFPLRGYVLM